MILTAEITTSQAQDGSTVYTARLRELPGIVTEGNSESAVINELLEVIRHLHARLGSAVIGLVTPSIASWSWRFSSREGREYVYGAEERDPAQRAEEEPEAVPV